MAERESAARSFYTVLLLALVCSALVSGAAVGLRERQEANRRLDQQKNILQAAGLYQPGDDIEKKFAAVEPRVVRLADGLLLPPEEMDPAEYDQLRAALQPGSSRKLSPEEDLAGLGRVEEYAMVYLVREEGKLRKVILPIRGKGLWSTMHGYLALSADLNSVAGVTFYQHGETPGLGGEIENPGWQQGWQGKEIYGSENRPQLRVSKGPAPEGEERRHRIDGISGATLTMNGVSNLLEFWFGEHGFKPFLERYRAGGL